MSLHYPTVLIAIATTLTALTALANPGNGNGFGKVEIEMFGKNNPFTLYDLPPGRTLDRLESLPPPARERAMDWLHKFDFPANDLDAMVIDEEGAVLYADPAPTDLPVEQAPAADGALPEASASAADDAFLLHSRPGAPNVVYLDFDGHTFSGTAWSSGTIQARPFDLDGSSSTFNDAERNAIAEIWHRVAEDFAAFDIDVTTEEPQSFGPQTGRVLITSKTKANGGTMPYGSYGGVAYVDVWGRSNYASYYSPALVYYDNLARATTYIAEACAHEFGHNLGLSHDGTSSVTYYAGHGSGATSWAPIMGNSYYNNVTQWSIGEYAGANNTQDDLAIIDAKLYLIDDDHGDTLNTASPLAVDGSGQILVSNPEMDPHNIYPENKGIIEMTGDQDLFYFNSDAGQVDLIVTPAWDAFYRNSKRGANLDIQASLLNAGGTALATSNPASETDASLSASVPAGTYYLKVTGVGNGNYSDYASAGQYFITGSLIPDGQQFPPTADYSFDCTDLSCNFSDNSSDSNGSITDWAWDFGDGSVSTAQSPSHSYASAGTYTVGLTVTDNDGLTSSTSKSVTGTQEDTVPPVVTPPADILREATAILTPVAIGTASTDDGSPVSNDAPAGGFPLGQTTVTWSATDASGNTGSATQSVTVVDTTPPQLTPPPDITITSGGDIGTATASDIFPLTVTNDAPVSFPVGNTSVTWTATDSSGNITTATQTITVNDVSDPPPANSIDFNNYPLSSFTTQDLQGTASIEDGGATLRLVGNTWKRIDFPYTVGPQTVIEFDFYSETEGEIHGIGLEEDNSVSENRIFTVHGTQGWGIRDFDNYPGSGWTHYRIPVGEFYNGSMAYMVFVMDDDASSAGESRFRNIMVHEGSSSNPPPANSIDFNNYPLSSFTTQDLQGTASIEDGGATLRLVGNTWKRIDFPYTVGPQTVIEFDFYSETEGEIHGIGLEEDNSVSENRIFTVHGTQGWGIRDFDNYPGSGWTHYRIPVGEFYNGSMAYMVFVMDDDASSAGESRFRNIMVHEGSSSNPPPANSIDFNNYPLSSFTTQDLQGTASIEDGGATLRLVGNTWKRIDFPYTVGPQTVIEFDFYSETEGEIHGIGLEEDNSVSENRIFTVHGTQGWGIRDFDNYPGSGWTHYRIPVGELYNGSMAYMVFVMDDDASSAGEVVFRNVTVYDD